MRGRWNLTEQELKYWKANAEGQAKAIILGESGIVDLSREDITPMQVDEVLSSLGWVNYEFIKDDEFGVWFHYSRKGNQDITLYVNGLTFEMCIYVKSDIENFSMKDLHVTEMNGEI